MNNQELIKKYEKLEGVCTDPGAEIARLIFLEDLRELDEPQKVTVPQIVADYIEYAKDCDWDLIDAMKGIGYEDCDDLLKWFYIGGTLVFKWSDCQVNVKKILELIPFKPLFGQRRGTTHWMTFVKFEEVE